MKNIQTSPYDPYTGSEYKRANGFNIKKPLRMQETIRETNKFRLYVLNARTYLQSKVGGRPATVRVRRSDLANLQNLSDPSFNASACLEFGCGLYQ